MNTVPDHRVPVRIGSKEELRRLLQSIVDVARAIFDARASSIFLLDDTGQVLTFEAVSGDGSGALLGRPLPADQGVAGWVLAAGQPLAVGDVTTHPRFARGFAESTGYVPRTIMASPLLHRERAVGVLEVLDHRPERTRVLGDLDLLALFAHQASAAIAVLQRIEAGTARGGTDGVHEALLDIADAVGSAAGARHESGLRLLRAVRDVLVDADRDG